MAAGDIVYSFLTDIISPHGMSHDGTNLWIADGNFASGEKIFEVDEDGDIQSSFSLSDVVDVSHDGTNLWCAVTQINDIEERTESGTLVSSFDSPDAGLGAVSHDGTNLWIGDRVVDKFFETNESGTILSSFDPPGFDITGGVSHDGTNLWHIEGRDTIYEQSETGTLISSFFIPNRLIQSEGITHNRRGLWLSDQDMGKIVKIDPGNPQYEISGVTKDDAGSALGSVECYGIEIDNTNKKAYFIGKTTSHATTGAYTIGEVHDNRGRFAVIFWKDDTPHVFDATDHVIVPSDE